MSHHRDNPNAPKTVIVGGEIETFEITQEEIDAVPSGDPGQWEISMRELCQEIEKLPASEQQTAISVKASAIYQSLGEFNRYCESFFDAAVSEKLCNFMNTHAFQPGDSEHGWEKQCSVIAPDGLRHCGGYREDHPMSVKAEGKRQKELRGETIPDDRQPAICPHCQTHWTYRDGKWNAAIKRHGRYCQCPDNWKCTICKALILNPADFAEYEKNGTHVACMEKELTGTEHFPPCEEWSHGWTNTETGVECSRCGVRRGNCPECGHDEHGAVCRMAKSGNGSVLQRLPSAHNAADRGRRLKANLCTKYRKVGFCAKKNTTAG